MIFPFQLFIDFIVTVVSDGKVIYCTPYCDYQLTTCYRSLRSDQVWLHYHLLPKDFKLKRGDSLLVYLTCEYHTCLNYRYVKSSKLVFFKSCGFHLLRKHEEKAIDLIQPSKRRCDDDDDGNLESNCYPQQKRHSSTPGTSNLYEENNVIKVWIYLSLFQIRFCYPLKLRVLFVLLYIVFCFMIFVA